MKKKKEKSDLVREKKIQAFGSATFQKGSMVQTDVVKGQAVGAI